MFLTSLLFVAFSFASYECAIIPDAVDLGNVGGFQERRNIGDGLRDWMRSMRERMANREPGRMMSLMSGGPLDLTNLSKIKLPPALISMMTGERMFQPVNLATVKFDPASDRGYRMGNWYVIRRRSTKKEESAEDWSDFFDRNDKDKWEVISNGVQRIDDIANAGCALPESKMSTMKTTTTDSKKDSGEVEEPDEPSAEVLGPTL